MNRGCAVSEWVNRRVDNEWCSEWINYVVNEWVVIGCVEHEWINELVN
jgi:hypothetical protein